jgi:tetratricopeptide (TPR) repeat protein
MEGNSDHYYLRRQSGSPVGPFSTVVLATMLRKGTLDGSEEISLDRRTWRPVRDIKPAPAPEAAPAFTAEGTEVLGGKPGGGTIMQSFSLAPPQDHGAPGAAGTPAAPSRLGALNGPPAPGGQNGRNQAADDFARGFGSDAGYRRSRVEPAPPAVNDAGSHDLAPLELDADDLIPLELAPLELAGPREPSAPVAMLLGDDDSMGLDSQEEPGSVPLLPTIRPDPPATDDGAGGVAGRDGAIHALALGGNTTRHRTMSAVRQRPMLAAAPEPSPKKRLAKGAVILLAGGGLLGLLGLGAKIFFFGEPTVATVLGPAAGEIESDRFAAYQQGAERLTEAAVARPKSVRLRAAAASLLASSVVLRRGDRARIFKAEALLAEPAVASHSSPELTRARGWIALAKGNLPEAARLAGLGGDDPEAQLQAGWIALGQGKPAEAAQIFERAAASSPARVALRYGLGRAQEEAGQAAATATYKAVLEQSKSHFGAALGLIRISALTPPARLAQAQALIAQAAGEASRTELADAQVLAGRAARLLGKLDESDAAYKRALAIDPADPAALVATGEALLEQGKMKEAVAKFQAAAPSAPVTPAATPLKDLRFAMAAVLIETGRPRPGLALLEQTKAAHGAPDPRRLFWQARAAELASPPDTAAARRSYEETLKAEPRFLPATLQLAALLVEQRRGAEGLAVLRRAEAAGVPAAALQLALGQAFLASGDVARANKTFRDTLVANPKLGAARIGLASSLEAAGNLGAARIELETLLAQAPETPGLRQHLAELLIGLNQKDLALGTYRTEIATGKAPAAMKIAAAKLALEIGHTDVALEITEKVVAEQPETPGALLLLGKIRRAAGDLGGAVTEIRRALAFESTPELHYEYGRVLLESGNPEEALAELELAPELPQAMIERARISLRRGDADRAVGPLEAAVKKAPGSGDGWLLLGNAYDRLGVPAKAEAAWKNAARTDPSGAEPHYRLGRMQMDQGQTGPALIQLRLAAAKVPPNGPWTADFYFQLGFAEKARGSRPAATVALRKYLALAPSDAPSRHEVEQALGNFSQ